MAVLEWGEDLSEVGTIWAVDKDGHRWVWQREPRIEAHDPADRLGDPYRLYDFVDEGSGQYLFGFAVVDSYFPLHDLVRANSWEAAYEAYIDWAADHRHLKIEEPDLKNYKEDELEYTSNGIPVDTENVQAFDLDFLGTEPRFAPKDWTPRGRRKNA